MGNHIYTILRVLGKKEDRQKFIDYASKLVPSPQRKKDYLNESEKIIAKIDNWYDFKMWENDKGTFCTFITINSEIEYNGGYQLHKMFPQLKFIYRAIDELLPNHCQMWEFSPEDEISDKKAIFYEASVWLKNQIGLLYFCTIKSQEEFNEHIYMYFQMLLEKCNGDFEMAQSIYDQYQEDDKKYGDFMDSHMASAFSSDKYFKMTEEELVNAPCIPDCTTTWENYK